MVSSVSADGIIASYRGITQNIHFKADGKAIHATVWSKKSGELLATIENLFLGALPSKTPQETLTWMLKNHYAFWWTKSQGLSYSQSLPGGAQPTKEQLLKALNRPDFIQRILSNSSLLKSCTDVVLKDISLKEQLFANIIASRNPENKNPAKVTLAANSITLLNAAHVHFSDRDLRDVQIPNAYLEGANLDHTLLDRANLTNVVLRNAHMQGCSFNRATMTGVVFGQKLLLETSEYLHRIAVSSDGCLLAASEYKGTVYLWDAVSRKQISILKGHEGMTILKFSPDNMFLVSACHDKTICVWNVKTQQCIHSFKVRCMVQDLTISPDSKILIIRGFDRFQLWEMFASNKLFDIKTYYDDHPPIFSSNSKFCVVKRDNNTLSLWNIQSKKWVDLLEKNKVDSFALSVSGKFLASCSSQGDFKVWNLRSMKCVKSLTSSNGKRVKTRCMFSSDDSRIVLVSNSHAESTIEVWDTKTGINIAKMKRKEKELPYSVTFSQNGKFLVSHGKDTVSVWRISSQECIGIVRNPSSIRSQLQAILIQNKLQVFVERGNYFILVEEWDLSSNKGLPIVVEGHETIVRSVDFFSERNHFTSACYENYVFQWDVESGSQVKAFRDPGKAGGIAVLSPDGNYLASISHLSSVLQIFDLQSGETPITSFIKPEVKTITSCTFSIDGKLLISGHRDGTMILWNLSNGEISKSFKGRSEQIESMTLSPKGDLLASQSLDETTCLWKMDTFENIATLKVSSHDALAFSPDGKLLVSKGENMSISLWDLESFRSVSFGKNVLGIRFIAFFPINTRYFATTYLAEIRIWDIETHRHVTKFKGCDKSLRQIAISPDENYLVGAGFDASVKVWKIQRTEDSFDFRLKWTSMPILWAGGAKIDGVKGLSRDNRALLMHYGAAADPSEDYDSDESSSSSTSEESSDEEPLLHPKAEPSALLKPKHPAKRQKFEQSISNLLSWVDHQFPSRDFSSATLEERYHIERLLAETKRLRESIPQGKEQLQESTQYFETQLQECREYFEGKEKRASLPVRRFLPSLPVSKEPDTFSAIESRLNDLIHDSQAIAELRLMLENIRANRKEEEPSEAVEQAFQKEISQGNQRIQEIEHAKAEFEQKLAALAGNTVQRDEYRKFKKHIEQLNLEHKQLMRDFLAKEHIRQQQQTLQKQPALWKFYKTTKIKLEESFFAYKVIASVEVDPKGSDIPTVIQLLGAGISLIPGLGNPILGFGINAGVSAYQKTGSTRKTNVAQRISSLLDCEEFLKLSEEVARTLAYDHKEEILQLRTLDEEIMARAIAKAGSRIAQVRITAQQLYAKGKQKAFKTQVLSPPERLAEFAVLCMIQVLKDDQLDQPLSSQVLLSGITESFSELAAELKSTTPSIAPVSSSAMVAKTGQMVSRVEQQTELTTVTVKKEIARRQSEGERMQKELAEMKRNQEKQQRLIERLLEKQKLGE